MTFQQKFKRYQELANDRDDGILTKEGDAERIALAEEIETLLESIDEEDLLNRQSEDKAITELHSINAEYMDTSHIARFGPKFSTTKG